MPVNPQSMLRQLASCSAVRSAARLLPPTASEMLLRFYYQLARPRNGVSEVRIEALSAKFRVPTPTQFLRVEALGDEQRLLREFVRFVRPGDCCYDVGAWIGLYSVFLAGAVGPSGTVVAFEPQDHFFKHLQDNVALNSLTNVRLFRMALGDGQELDGLYPQDDCGRYSPANVCEDGSDPIAKVMTGDEVVRVNDLPVPRAVKIDVEGHEYAVLRGLRNTLGDPQCQLVCCEIHPGLLAADVTVGSIIDLLKSLGFAQVEMLERRGDLHAMAYKQAAVAAPPSM